MDNKPFFKKSVINDTTVTSEDKKLAETPPLATVRVAEQGDWAASNNPSPDEQVAEVARGKAIEAVKANKDSDGKPVPAEHPSVEQIRDEHHQSTAEGYPSTTVSDPFPEEHLSGTDRTETIDRSSYEK